MTAIDLTLLQSVVRSGPTPLFATISGALSSDDLTVHQPQLDRLLARLDQAFQDSQLPDEPTTAAALDDYVVRARLTLGHHA